VPSLRIWFDSRLAHCPSGLAQVHIHRQSQYSTGHIRDSAGSNPAPGSTCRGSPIGRGGDGLLKLCLNLTTKSSSHPLNRFRSMPSVAGSIPAWPSNMGR
jgi:hypothetical protein